MKCLSVKQPFTALIACGKKKYEIRSYQTRYRGDLAIQASLTAHELYSGYDFATGKLFLKNLSAPSTVTVPWDLFQRSGVLCCVVTLTNCIPFEEIHEKFAFCDWLPGLWAWELSGVREIAPFPIKGKLGIFDIPIDVIKMNL